MHDPELTDTGRTDGVMHAGRIFARAYVGYAIRTQCKAYIYKAVRELNCAKTLKHSLNLRIPGCDNRLTPGPLWTIAGNSRSINKYTEKEKTGRN